MIRAERLAELGLIDVMDPAALTGEMLSKWMLAMPRGRADTAVGRLDFGGLNRIRGFAGSLLRAGETYRPTAVSPRMHSALQEGTMIRQKKPKIAYVLKRYPRYSETFIVNELLAHEAAGREIEIFALRPVEESHFQDNLGRVKAPVSRIPEQAKNASALWTLMEEARARFPGFWSILGTLEAANVRDITQALHVALACQSRGIDHLHAHFGTAATAVARLAAAFAGIGYSFTAHAKDIYCDYEEAQHLDLKLHDADAIITVSDYNVAYLQEAFGPAANRVTRIYNGIDLAAFAYAPPGAGDEILAVGRLVEKKGFHILIEAVRLMHEAGRTAFCRIVGAGEEAKNLAAQIEASGLAGSIELAGPLPQAEVIAAMRRAGVLACPCVVGNDGNRDGLPTVLLEAMALGTPCVATDVTGIPELVRDGVTGLCVGQGDPEALAEALGRMLDNRALRFHLSRAGRALVEREFDQVANAARQRDVLDAAIDARTQLVRGAA
jgi:colanic acid/amylovoran biosynthesis glycosyltransferase